jgi:dihydrolipoamide dehydrogenase
VTTPGRLVVIGGGVGGYTGAIRAARAGFDVTLVESGALGGTCLNVGCIPTKSLLHQAHGFRAAGDMAHFGVDAARLSVALGTVMARKDEAVRRLTSGVRLLVQRNRIRLVQGTAAFLDARTVAVRETGERLVADHVLVASGSEPVLPPIPGIDLPGVVTSDGAVALATLPRRVLVIGGGVIGVEFAQIFGDFGVAVTVVERQARILPEEDEEAAAVLQGSLRRHGVGIVAGAAVQAIQRTASGLGVRLQTPTGPREQEVDLVLVAVGRRPRLRGLDLEKAGIQAPGGAIAVDAYCRTSVPHVYAVGDVCGGPLLAHKASMEAECAIAHLCGQPWSRAGRVVPSAVYTAPQIATAGLTEAQARKHHPKLLVGRFPFAASGMAIASGHTEGFVKVLADGDTEQIVGIVMAGPDVANLLGEATLAVQMELTLPALMQTVHAHPTLSEALMEAAHDAHDGGAIHLPPRPAAPPAAQLAPHTTP